MMNKYLSFHLSFYDIDRNSPGSILTKMSINTIQLKEFIRTIVGAFINIIVLFLAALIAGCIQEYRLTLITIVFIPFIIFINIIKRLALQSDSSKSIQSSMEGGSIVSECVTNTKTIFAYNFKLEAIYLYLEANYDFGAFFPNTLLITIFVKKG